MPLFYTQTIDQYTRLAIWQIAEPLDFFLEKVPMSRQFSHPHKQLQHVAGRYLLQWLFPDFPMALIQIAHSRKPYLASESHHFSISHCGSFAAAIVSTKHRVGIDIEEPTERIRSIVPKFLSEKERQLFAADSNSTSQQLITTLWSAKEAMFKWYGLGQVDFRQHLHVQAVNFMDGQQGEVHARFAKNDPVIVLQLPFVYWPNLVLTWVIE